MTLILVVGNNCSDEDPIGCHNNIKELKYSYPNTYRKKKLKTVPILGVSLSLNRQNRVKYFNFYLYYIID